MKAEPRIRPRRFWGPRRWHRYLGAAFALPLIWLCVTGLLLQHQDWLGLSERKVSSAWLLKRYGQIPEGEPRSVQAGRFTVAEWDGVLFLDAAVLEGSGTLVGAVAKPAELVIATDTELFVYDAQGSYLDRLGEESLPAVPIRQLGLDADGRVLLEVEGGHQFASADLLDFEEAEAGAVRNWSKAGTDTDLRTELQKSLAAGAGFTWSRVVTDLHSGSLFGAPGKLLVDLTGIAVLVLTLFGIRLLFKRT